MNWQLFLKVVLRLRVITFESVHITRWTSRQLMAARHDRWQMTLYRTRYVGVQGETLLVFNSDLITPYKWSKIHELYIVIYLWLFHLYKWSYNLTTGRVPPCCMAHPRNCRVHELRSKSKVQTANLPRKKQKGRKVESWVMRCLQKIRPAPDWCKRKVSFRRH